MFWKWLPLADFAIGLEPRRRSPLGSKQSSGNFVALLFVCWLHSSSGRRISEFGDCLCCISKSIRMELWCHILVWIGSGWNAWVLKIKQLIAIGLRKEKKNSCFELDLCLFVWLLTNPHALLTIQSSVSEMVQITRAVAQIKTKASNHWREAFSFHATAFHWKQSRTSLLVTKPYESSLCVKHSACLPYERTKRRFY